jgi:hypothetical protein
MWQHAKQGFSVDISPPRTIEDPTIYSQDPTNNLVLQIHNNVSDAVAAAALY